MKSYRFFFLATVQKNWEIIRKSQQITQIMGIKEAAFGQQMNEGKIKKEI